MIALRVGMASLQYWTFSLGVHIRNIAVLYAHSWKLLFRIFSLKLHVVSKQGRHSPFRCFKFLFTASVPFLSPRCVPFSPCRYLLVFHSGQGWLEGLNFPLLEGFLPKER